VRRLRLVRAMVETAARALASHRAPFEEPEEADLETARAIVRRRGWKRIPRDHEYLKTLADVIGRLRLLGLADLVEHEDRYALAAEQVAEADIHLLMQREERDEILETMIVGTVLGDALLTTLRRIAQVEISGRDIKGPDRDPTDPECLLSTSDTRAGPSAPAAAAAHAQMAMSALVGFRTVQVEWAVLR
jgi:hypothetical protein